ncbi:MAG TPA: NCS2 family permease [Thermoanaerobaculia bacterium]|jgi:AGZA family xanthine/uracil permease-like MFS transporter|nr:NCS2 family permease [Thermoanaerobaculia bacterium]
MPEGLLERIFGIRAAGSTPAREALGGLATFLTMAYILFVNPVILQATGMPLEGAIAATAISAAIGTLLMGLLANYPVALAPGMGLNAFFAYGICLGAGVPWQTALGIVFWTGLLFVLLTVVGARALLVRAVPPVLTRAGAVGIGLFIAFIGLQQGGLIRADPNTLVSLAPLSSRPALLTLFGLGVTLLLFARGIRTAIFWGLLASIVAALATGAVPLPHEIVRVPHFALPGLEIDLLGALSWRYLPLILTTLFFTLFDTLGTLLAVGHQAGLANSEGELPRLDRALTADATGMVTGALVGTSAVTSYIESGAGVAAGARTGFANMVTGALLFASLVISPLVEVVGLGVDGRYPITAPALLLVGILMMGAVREIEWSDPTEAAPGFLTAVLMPLTFNIAHGLAAGFIVYPLAKAAAGKWREVHPALWGLAVLLVLRYALLPP